MMQKSNTTYFRDAIKTLMLGECVYIYRDDMPSPFSGGKIGVGNSLGGKLEFYCTTQYSNHNEMQQYSFDYDDVVSTNWICEE